MTYAFLIALAAGGLASGLLAAMWQAAKVALVKERADHQKTQADLAATLAALKVSEQARGENTARLEALISQKQSEIAALEADQYACNSPALVRERLRKLLSPPAPAGAGVAPLGTVPFGSAPKP